MTTAYLISAPKRSFIDIKKLKNSNFSLIYKYKNEKSHLISFIQKYLLKNIQYICDIKKNKFKSENIIKLNNSIRYIRKAARSLKISISNLKIKAKKKDYIFSNIKNIIFIL